MQHKSFGISFASVYPLYVAKVERKGQHKDDLDQILRWLTGYEQTVLDAHIAQGTTFRDFFGAAKALNPNRALIKGVVCGVRVEEIENPLMQNIRYLDKLVDELAKGRAMVKILRS